MNKTYLIIFFSFFICIITFSHPHVFIDLSLDVKSSEKNNTSLFIKWKVDEMFSFNIINDFDKDGDLILNNYEIKDLESEISQNFEKNSYYTFITIDDMKINLKPVFSANVSGNNIFFNFKYNIKNPFKLCKIRISDKSFYHAFDFSSPSSTSINDYEILSINSDEEKGYSQGIEKIFIVKNKNMN